MSERFSMSGRSRPQVIASRPVSLWKTTVPMKPWLLERLKRDQDLSLKKIGQLRIQAISGAQRLAFVVTNAQNRAMRCNVSGVVVKDVGKDR
jgi:hypothetical protein